MKNNNTGTDIEPRGTPQVMGVEKIALLRLSCSDGDGEVLQEVNCNWKPQNYSQMY